jgi:hypothetical protein
MREKFQDARRAFELSLKLQPQNNPTAFSLANLHAMHGNIDEALPPAKLALEALWADDAFRTSTDGRKMHVMLARMLTEAELKSILGESLLALAREGLEMYDGSWTDEQRDRSVYASLEFGGPNHDEALREAIDVTEEVWFDSAVALVSRQFDANRSSMSGPTGRFRQGMESEIVFSRLVPLAIACTKLNPNHIDAWVLAARLRDMGVSAGYGSEDQAFQFALDALERIAEFETTEIAFEFSGYNVHVRGPRDIVVSDADHGGRRR